MEGESTTLISCQISLMELLYENSVIAASQVLKTPPPSILRSSRPEEFCKNGLYKNFTKFAGKHLCRSFCFNKAADLTLTHRHFPARLAKFLRTLFFIVHFQCYLFIFVFLIVLMYLISQAILFTCLLFPKYD